MSHAGNRAIASTRCCIEHIVPRPVKTTNSRAKLDPELENMNNVEEVTEIVQHVVARPQYDDKTCKIIIMMKGPKRQHIISAWKQLGFEHKMGRAPPNTVSASRPGQ